jgi:hypothetical protein
MQVSFHRIQLTSLLVQQALQSSVKLFSSMEFAELFGCLAFTSRKMAPLELSLAKRAQMDA